MSLSRRAMLARSTAVAVAGTLGLRASAEAQVPEDTLRVAFAARGNRTLDPIKTIQGADVWSIVHIHDTLVSSPDGHFATRPDEYQPRLAKSWSMSPDGRTWTFVLRENVKFHKGYGEFTADDVVFSLNRARDPKLGGGNMALFGNIVDVKADGKYRAVVTLKQPDPLFLGGTIQDSACVIMSRKATEEKGENIQRDPVGTGPYQFVSLDPDTSKGIMLTANPDYFEGPPATKNIQIMYLLDTTARTLALLSGNVHMIEGVRAPGWSNSIQQKNPKLLFDVAAPGSLFTMHFNMSRKPLDDVRVRRAFAHAIDRDAIVKAMSPISRRTYGLNAPGFPGGLTLETTPMDLRYPFDPAKAKALLTEAGFPNGFSMEAYTSQREDYKSVMLIVQEQMRKVGVNINMQVIDHTTFHANNRKNMNTLPQNSTAYPPAPSIPLRETLGKESEVKTDGSGGVNYSHYGVLIPGIDALLDAAGEEADFDKRVALMRQAEIKVLQDLPLIPISTNGYFVVRDPKVKLGYEISSGFAYWRLNKAKIV